MFNVAPPKTVEETTIIKEDDRDRCPGQIGPSKYGWKDTLDNDIAETAGFDSGMRGK